MAGHERDPDFDDWVQRARDADPLPVAQRLGARLKKAGRDWHGACPACGGTDRFVVTPGQPDAGKRWMCRGARGGDVIAMAQHCLGGDFLHAVEFITGESPPRGRQGREPDPEVARERRHERTDQKITATARERQEARRKMMSANELWDLGKPLRGTTGWDYFGKRGINLTDELAFDLRFCARLEYRGFADDGTDELTPLGEFPCILAAMRNVTGEITAVHRTYLDAAQPIKLSCPGDRSRNRAKKVMGKPMGSMIRLGMIGDVLAIGEGIETALSWLQVGAPDAVEVSIAAAYSLGNISGGATGTIPHPERRDKTIMNGFPNKDAPGVILPTWVEGVILLGDGDSDKATTLAALLTGARRFRDQGKAVSIAMARDGGDWNDILLEQAGTL